MMGALLISFLSSLFLSYFLIKYQKEIKLFAVVNRRSVHTKLTPNSGGIAIVGSFFLFLTLIDIHVNYALTFSLLLVLLFGIYDDKFGASSKQKIIFIFLISNILYFNGFYITYLGTFIGHEVYTSGIFTYLLLSFALIGFINSINLIDGLDGLASLIGIVILGSFLYMGIKFHDSFLIYLTSGYIAALVGFLFFNYAPAKIFMGDGGSLSLGFIIAIVAIHAINEHYVTLVTALLLAALPVLDTFLVMTRRLLSGKNPFQADKLHIHHVIHKLQGYDTRKTVLILVLIQMIFSYLGLGFKTRDDLLVIILFFMFYLLAYHLLRPKY